MQAREVSKDEEQQISQRIKYDPESGQFYWKIDINGRGGKAGDLIKGSLGGRGYLRVRVCGRLYTMHRIAWFLSHKEWPEQIDHADHVRTNNKLQNLSAVSNAVNRLNQEISPRNTSGVTGVDWYKRDKKWRVQICINGKHQSLGCYTDFDEACAVRAAANTNFGFHQNHGKRRNEK